MDPTKQEASSELLSDDTMGTGRSYECTFCKRGFTNAQALGGHMNIHRKEKGKSTKHHKQHQKYSKVDDDDDDHFMVSNSRYVSTHQHHHRHNQNYHPTSALNYQFHSPPPNPSYPDESRQRFERISADDAYLGVNFSLQIGGSSVADGEKREEIEGNGVDLELRLGVDHRDSASS